MPSTTNRGYTYPAEYADDWYSTWVTLINAIDTDMNSVIPGNLTADIKIKKSTPAVRFTGTETGAEDFRIVEDAGDLLVQRNDGSEAAPSWTTLVTLENDGDVKLAVADKGIILKSANGNTFRVSVDNAGAIQVTST